mgnify:FL=1
MIKSQLIYFYFFLILFFGACTSHPPVVPEVPKDGDTKMGFSFSVENIIPTIWWRHALNNYTDVGFKLGIPISGTGIDINRLLMKKDRRWDMLNLAYSISPNSSLDLTYYMFKVHKKEKLSFLKPPLRTRWRAFRLMIIPNGTYDNPSQRGSKISTRLGLLFGRRFGEKWGFETGYFHDIKAGWSDNKDYPHKDPEKPHWPTQFSRGMGVSLQLFLYLPSSEKN